MHKAFARFDIVIPVAIPLEDVERNEAEIMEALQVARERLDTLSRRFPWSRGLSAAVCFETRLHRRRDRASLR